MVDLVDTAYDNLPDESKLVTDWQGGATIEVYISSDIWSNVGNVTGPVLYDTVWQSLAALCPSMIGRNNNKKCYPNFLSFPTKYKTDNNELRGKLPATTSHNPIHMRAC